MESSGEIIQECIEPNGTSWLLKVCQHVRTSVITASIEVQGIWGASLPIESIVLIQSFAVTREQITDYLSKSVICLTANMQPTFFLFSHLHLILLNFNLNKQEKEQHFCTHLSSVCRQWSMSVSQVQQTLQIKGKVA